MSPRPGWPLASAFPFKNTHFLCYLRYLMQRWDFMKLVDFFYQIERVQSLIRCCNCLQRIDFLHHHCRSGWSIEFILKFSIFCFLIVIKKVWNKKKRYFHAWLFRNRIIEVVLCLMQINIYILVLMGASRIIFRGGASASTHYTIN